MFSVNAEWCTLLHIPILIIITLCTLNAVLAKQAEKKAIMEKIELGKRAKNNKKRPRPFNDPAEPLLKRPKSRGDLVSNSPSPMMVSSRPGSVLSTASTVEPVNGSLDHQGSTDGSEGNLEGSGPNTTPVRKLGKSRLGGAMVNAGGSRKQTAAPLGGRGKMQRSGKKAGSRNAAAASAGAIAGAKAATNAALAAYGLPTHHISVSPSGSPAVSGSSHSSPRVSPVPMAFVATSLITTPPTNKLSSKTTSLGNTPPTNKNSKAPSSLTYAKSNL